MKYIKIKNIGVIETPSLFLIGGSTKVNDKSKVGQFGSGSKYALAYFLRNNYKVSIFAGLDEIKIETKTETFRETDFHIIYVNGEKTSITTQMGKDWELWQAIREIYCNALDEGECELEYVNHINPALGETHFYIETQKDITSFVANFNNYFATNKKVLFECEKGRILEKSGTEANIYRKGIRCANLTKVSVFDYDFPDIDIDENRIVRYSWQIEERVWDLIFRCDNEEVIMQILHMAYDNSYLEGTASDYITVNSSPASEKFKEVLRQNKFVSRAHGGLLKPDEVNNHIFIPHKVFESVRGLLNDENVPARFMVGRVGGIFREIESNGLYDETIRKALEFLNECQFNVFYEIKIALFDDKDVMGCAYKGEIYLADICLEKGVNEVVNTLVEEFLHIKYDVQDETRGFQTAAITEFISYMKKVNAFAI